MRLSSLPVVKSLFQACYDKLGTSNVNKTCEQTFSTCMLILSIFSRNELNLGLLRSRSTTLLLPFQLGTAPTNPRKETGNEHLGSGVLGSYCVLLLHY